MHRQASSRNQKSKGIRVKHVLQICLLLAVCFWLIYQVKHSHDKKKEFDESDVKSSISREGSDVYIRLGRKDIHPQEEDAITKNEKHDEEAEDEEETTGVVDDNKHEEDELEDKKVEDTENEKVGGGDDEVEDHGQEKLDTEVEREEDFVDGKKERDEDGENESEEKDSEDGGQMEKESSIERDDHDGDDSGTHEAREEHYKADDASSAVTHDTQVEVTENENQNNENDNGHPENILEETDTGEKRKELEEGGEMAIDEKQSNVTNDEIKENMMDVSENDSSLNTTVTEVFDFHSETSNSSMEISTDTNDHKILSEGTSLERSNLQIIDVDQADNSTLVVDDNRFDSNSTNPDETKEVESNTLKKSEISKYTDSSTETSNAIDTDKSDASDGANKSLESENTENSQEILQDSIDLSDSFHPLEETNTRVDLDTLPEIQTEGTNTEDTASE